jgi:sirohydrochlorin cobaltochelatase
VEYVASFNYNEGMENEFIILATHGIPPRDFPDEEKAEFFRLHSMADSGNPLTEHRRERYKALEVEMRNWPRTAQNDPFHRASHELATEMEKQSGKKVICGFNEFCAPDVSQAIRHAVGQGAKKIVVITPMLTRGGAHAETEITQIVAEARKEYPGVEIIYAWPFVKEKIAAFLLEQIDLF